MVVIVERRRIQRDSVHKPARIVFSEKAPPVDCVVSNLTSHGAGLYMPVTMPIPKRFELSFDNFRSTRLCQLIWQEKNRFGVSFS
jgi:PilZ domain